MSIHKRTGPAVASAAESVGGASPGASSANTVGARRVWLHEVEVEVIALRGELDVIESRAVAPGQNSDATIIASVRALLDRAEAAAEGAHPPHRPLLSWWTGDCVEAAFRCMHRAEAEIALLYDAERADAVAPEAIGRLIGALRPGDPRRELVRQLEKLKGHASTPMLSKAIQIGHEAKDQQYAKVRRFRNIVLSASALILFFMTVFAVIVSKAPAAVPLCFDTPSPPAPFRLVCPTSEVRLPSGGDVWIVCLLGLLGGSLAAAVSIRNIRGAPTPYNLATALALLKVPAGALTAVGALVLINGQIVPGLSTLTTQEQILSYAFVFGYAQQLLTGLVDRRAADIVAGVRAKGPDEPVRQASGSTE